MNGTSARPFVFAVVLGIIGGIALVGTAALTNKGLLLLIPYVAMLIAAIVYFRSHLVPAFRQRFNASLVAFLVSNLISYVYLLTVAKTGALSRPIVTNLWPLAAIVGIGLIVSAAVAAVTPGKMPATR